MPPTVHTERGWVAIDEKGQTSDVKVFAVGDATSLGLVTHAIGSGKMVAETIHYALMHSPRLPEKKPLMPYERIKTVYYEACQTDFSLEKEGDRCLSCATCRDCRMCEAICYHGAISRVEHQDGSYKYIVNDEKCIGCGFCAGICPCGVWEMEESI